MTVQGRAPGGDQVVAIFASVDGPFSPHAYAWISGSTYGIHSEVRQPGACERLSVFAELRAAGAVVASYDRLLGSCANHYGVDIRF